MKIKTKIKCPGIGIYSGKCRKFVPKYSKFFYNGERFCCKKCFDQAKDKDKLKQYQLRQSKFMEDMLLKSNEA